MNIVKIICSLLLLCAVPFWAKAATPITTEMAEKYFSNCVSGAQKDGTMTAENQKRYCACTAMNMQKSMSQEDLSILSSPDKSIQRQSVNKILIDVNGPCMQYPIHDLINKKCMTDLKNEAICSCLSTRMGQFTKQQSQKMMPQILADNPEIFDPLTPIMESQEFQKTQQQIALYCATHPNQK